jgi:hypothetical protein
MDTYWLLSATASQGTIDESEMIYSAEEGPAFMKELADMTHFGNADREEHLQETEM